MLCFLELWSTFINYLEFFCTGDLPLLSHLPIDSVFYLYQYELMNTYFLRGYNPVILYFVAQIILYFHHWMLLCWVL